MAETTQKRKVFIGTSEQQRANSAEAENPLEDQLKLQEGQNLVRIIQGPSKIKTLFYASIKEQEEDGKKFFAPTYVPINFLDNGGLVDSLYTIESTIRAELKEVKPNNAFRAKPNWWYFALDKKARGDFRVQPFKIGKGLKDRFVEIEEERDPEDPEFLLNGPFYLYDIIIKKTIEPGKPKQYGTSYGAEVYNNPYRSKIPADWLNASSEDIIAELGGYEKLFSEKEMEAIEACDFNLDDIIKSMTVMEIKEKLMKYPINLSGLKPNSADFMFPQVPEFKILVEELGLPTVDYDFREKAPARSNDSSIKSGGVTKGVGLAKPKPTVEEPIEDAKVIEEVQKGSVPEAPAKDTSSIPATEAPKKRSLTSLKKNNI